MFDTMLKRRPIRWLVTAALVVCGAVQAAAAEVQFPAGNSLGLIPPPGLQRIGDNPGFFDPDHDVSMLLLELPHPA
jgi:hypothetical protein